MEIEKGDMVNNCNNCLTGRECFRTMLLEHFILTEMWLFGFAGFFLFIPRKDLRKGILAFLVFQAIIWLCDMPSFKYGLLSSPVREFPKASDLPITIDYFFYPVLFSTFYVNKKINGKRWYRFAYFITWVTAITLFDITLEIYTDLLDYKLLPKYGMWVYICFLFYVSEIFCNWFLKDQALYQTNGGRHIHEN